MENLLWSRERRLGKYLRGFDKQNEPGSMGKNSSLAIEQMQNHSGRKHGKCEKLQIVPFRLSQTPINVKGCSIV